MTSANRRNHRRLKPKKDGVISFQIRGKDGRTIDAELVEMSRIGLRLRILKTSIEEIKVLPVPFYLHVILREKPDAWAFKMDFFRPPKNDGDTWEIAARVADEDSRRRFVLLGTMLRNSHTLAEEDTFDLAEPIPGRGEYTEEARAERVRFAEAKAGSKLSNIASTYIRPRNVINNVENFIGCVEVPVGLAGPLLLLGETGDRIAYAPIATTEGALVASITRGATAISRAGGVRVSVIHNRINRAPIFYFDTMAESIYFHKWLLEHFRDIKQISETVSNHARLIDLRVQVLGALVFANFIFETADAAGQNVSTTCTWHACNWIVEQFQTETKVEIRKFLIESNFSSDKKVSFKSLLEGRGRTAVAECFISNLVLQQVLKISDVELVATYNSIVAGALQAGMVGFNINVANVVAGIFTATGQDIASVHESSLAQFYLEAKHNGVYLSLTMPSLIVGTVGGGTGLRPQSDYLTILGCQGQDRGDALAEAIAGFGLALEISTLAAVVSGQFALAHERLGKNRPKELFSLEQFTPQFFRKHFEQIQEDSRFDGISQFEFEQTEEFTGGIITELTAAKSKKCIGIFPLKATAGFGHPRKDIDLVLKSKPIDLDLLLVIRNFAALAGHHTLETFFEVKDLTEFALSHRREIDVYKLASKEIADLMPTIYGTFLDEESETCLLLMEDLRTNTRLLNADEHPVSWKEADIRAALEGIARIHAYGFKNRDEFNDCASLAGHIMTSQRVKDFQSLWNNLFQFAKNEFPEILDKRACDLYEELLFSVPKWSRVFDRHPITLIHNDFNPRNLCFKKGDSDTWRLCIYDWELAVMNLPQRDVVEFLSFVLTQKTSAADLEYWLEFYRTKLFDLSGIRIDESIWREGLVATMNEFILHRLGFYLLGHKFKSLEFLPRVVSTAQHLRKLLELNSQEASNGEKIPA